MPIGALGYSASAGGALHGRGVSGKRLDTGSRVASTSASEVGRAARPIPP